MTDWANHPLLQNMEPLKRELIQTAAMQTAGKSGNTLAPVLMSLITSANRKGVRFTSEEIALILEVLKSGKSETEKQQIDRTVQLVSSMLTKGKK